MARGGNPFTTRSILAMVLVGSAAFLLLLYAIARGWDGSDEQAGTAHAAADGLQGFSALVKLTEARGYDAELSRSESKFNDDALLVLTPEAFSDGERLTQIIEDRRWRGPTIVILPKWYAFRASGLPGQDDPPNGWVRLYGQMGPGWLEEFETARIELYGRSPDEEDTQRALIVRQTEDAMDEEEESEPAPPGYSGFGMAGTLPQYPAQWMNSADLVPVIADDEGRMLVGYSTDSENEGLDAFALAASAEAARETEPEDRAGETATAPPDIVVTTDEYYYDDDEAFYPVVIVAEPDLLNNYGLADEDRARAAMALIDATVDGADIPIVFDMVVPGYGQADNLLTMAFTPPFLAATLCLLLAALVIGWRAFRRYGPPMLAGDATTLGKSQLVGNGAALLERTRRFHLLGDPYANLMGARIARALGIRTAQPEARAQAIETALARRAPGMSFIEAANFMRSADNPRELLRGARALKDIERTIRR
ncbi:hypothetical protein [Paraurantiacibacter namhicola]|uniref:DUF4350 domain-containing protein n=1 Tax=Paraurantiacibacter namhicola TaxID=645517 RepID=A0A1C7DBH1_9SPHN|nr:hypothetical protein [Paraurantiacibacter namhicola]ANU08794.1 hypothetical protein A6F65_02516 [Paraurantiacibacter namhicola]